MKHRAIIGMALMFAQMDSIAQKTLLETNSYKAALKGTRFSGVSVGNNPIYIQSWSQRIKSKRLAKHNGR